MMRTRLCIVGGGPAGLFAALLFARAGVETLVLEKHGDFLRDFRGDTVHPSTLRLLAELGLLDRFLERPHDKLTRVGVHIGGTELDFADFSGFDPRWGFIAMMPQWDFLDFLHDEASAYPGYTLRRSRPATDLLIEEGRVVGVRCGEDSVRADLVILADGRGSRLRDLAGLPLRRIGAPMDVFWFRLPKARGPENETAGYFNAGRIVILIDRGDYWQCAYLFAKGKAETVRDRGIVAFRDDVAQAAPPTANGVESLAGWEDVKLLSVALDRLDRWHCPGLLAIGDAAHAMSPIGGVGINVAIQDAVAAANILAAPLAKGRAIDGLLGKVRDRRIFAVRATQAFQNAAQRRIIAPLLARSGGPIAAPWPLRLMNAAPPLRRLPAALIGFGPRPEHIRSPAKPDQPPPGVSGP